MAEFGDLPPEEAGFTIDEAHRLRVLVALMKLGVYKDRIGNEPNYPLPKFSSPGLPDFLAYLGEKIREEKGFK